MMLEIGGISFDYILSDSSLWNIKATISTQDISKLINCVMDVVAHNNLTSYFHV